MLIKLEWWDMRCIRLAQFFFLKCCKISFGIICGFLTLSIYNSIIVGDTYNISHIVWIEITTVRRDKNRRSSQLFSKIHVCVLFLYFFIFVSLAFRILTKSEPQFHFMLAIKILIRTHRNDFERDWWLWLTNNTRNRCTLLISGSLTGRIKFFQRISDEMMGFRSLVVNSNIQYHQTTFFLQLFHSVSSFERSFFAIVLMFSFSIYKCTYKFVLS